MTSHQPLIPWCANAQQILPSCDERHVHTAASPAAYIVLGFGNLGIRRAHVAQQPQQCLFAGHLNKRADDRARIFGQAVCRPGFFVLLKVHDDAHRPSVSEASL